MAAAFGEARDELVGARGRLREIRDRAAELRGRALDLGERELHSYDPVLQALRLPRDDPDRAARLTAARAGAAEAPLQLTRAAAEVAGLAQEAAALGSRHLLGDARTALLLAEAACQAAAGLVEINLEARPDDARRREARELARRAAAIRAAAATLD